MRGKKVLGVIAIQSYIHENIFDKQQLSFLSNIAAQAAIAIDNYNLLMQAKNYSIELEKLNQLSQSILKGENPQQIIENAAEVACKLTGGDVGMILLFRKNENSQTLYRIVFWFRSE